jgi:V8-like Glu-specific endopeptidase
MATERDLWTTPELDALMAELRVREKRDRGVIRRGAWPTPESEQDLVARQRAAFADGVRDEIASLPTEEVAARVEAIQRTIYGADDRLDVYQVTGPAFLNDLDSCVQLWTAGGITDNGNGTSTLQTRNHGTAYQLCAGQAFRSQPVGTTAFCSGCLVGSDLVLTAGHCLYTYDDWDSAAETAVQRNISDLRVVFGFHMLNASTARTVVSNDDIYTVVEIVQLDFSHAGIGAPGGVWDSAVLRLDRTVTGHAVASVRKGGTPPIGHPVHAGGYPSGLPLKYAGNAIVRDRIEGVPRFEANLDLLHGNSGSPVFDSEDHAVVGVFTTVGTDSYVWTGTCYVAQACPDTGCAGVGVVTGERFGTAIPGALDPYPEPEVDIPDTVLGTGSQPLRISVAQASSSNIRFDVYIDQTKQNAAGPLEVNALAEHSEDLTHTFEFRTSLGAGDYTVSVVHAGTTSGAQGTLWIHGATFNGEPVAAGAPYPIGLAGPEQFATIALAVPEETTPPAPPPPPLPPRPTQGFQINGTWPGQHTVTVQFINNLDGGTPETDRNLYVEGVSWNGVAVPGGTASLLSDNASASWTVGSPLPQPPPLPRRPLLDRNGRPMIQHGRLLMAASAPAAPQILPPPLVSVQTATLADAHAFVAPLTMGINLDRRAAWRVAAGGLMDVSGWAYVRGTLGLTHVRVFYPHRLFYNMLGEGTQNPTRSQFDRLLDSVADAVAAGLKVLLCCSDTLEAGEVVGSNFDQMRQHISNCASWIAARGFDPAKVAVGPVDEWHGDEEAVFRQVRIDFNARLRAALPRHVLLHSGPYGGHPSRLLNEAGGQDFRPLADKGVVYEVHSYQTAPAAEWAALQTRFDEWSSSKGAGPVVYGEMGLGALFTDELRPWTYPESLAAMVPALAGSRPVPWAITRQDDWRLNKPSSSRLRDGSGAVNELNLEALMINAQAAVRTALGL